MFPRDFGIWKFCYLYSEKLSHVTEFRNQTTITAIKMTDDAPMFNDERLTPHRTVHPGEILREELRERGISTDDFARRLGMSSRNHHNFLRGDLPLSKVDVDKYGVTASQPMEQREQKPNLFGLCQVATEEDDSQPFR